MAEDLVLGRRTRHGEIINWSSQSLKRLLEEEVKNGREGNGGGDEWRRRRREWRRR